MTLTEGHRSYSTLLLLLFVFHVTLNKADFSFSLSVLTVLIMFYRDRCVNMIQRALIGCWESHDRWVKRAVCLNWSVCCCANDLVYQSNVVRRGEKYRSNTTIIIRLSGLWSLSTPPTAQVGVELTWLTLQDETVAAGKEFYSNYGTEKSHLVIVIKIKIISSP